MVSETAAGPRALHVECVTSREELGRLRTEWDALWASMPDRTPFQHSAWLLPWADVFAPGELAVLVVRIERALAGIAPFYVSTPGNGRRELRLLGAGISDYLDVLVEPAHAGAVADAVSSFLADSGGRWSFCAFDHLRPRSLLLRVRVPAGCEERLTTAEPCPVLALPRVLAAGPASPGAASSDTSADLARRIAKCRRRAKRYGDIRVEHATRETVLPLLSTLFTLHGARWKAACSSGVLADERVRAFHRAAAPGMLAAGLLRLMLVRVAGRVAAAHYGLVAGGGAYFYIGGFAPELSSISPGKLAVALAIEQAIADGASTFDFLGGREAYKYEWGARDCDRMNRYLTRLSARSR